MTNRPKQWRERLEAKGGDPQTFLGMGQTLGEMMDLADKGLAPAGAQAVKEQAEFVDWGKAYHDSPHVLTQVARSFGPTMDAELPSEETMVGPLLRERMDKAKGIMERVDALTDQRTGRTRLQFYDVSGCTDPVCPLCQRKTRFITCPRCTYHMPNTHARILPKQDFLVVVRHAGVYCPRCWKPLLSEAQAHLMGIPKEAA